LYPSALDDFIGQAPLDAGVSGACSDEVVEARKIQRDHPPADDHRRCSPSTSSAKSSEAADGFLRWCHINPGYQNVLKDLKHSTRHASYALSFHFPDMEREAKIIAHEWVWTKRTPRSWRNWVHKVRNLREHGLKEGASTRVLIYAGGDQEGIAPRRACHVAVTWGITGRSGRCSEVSMKSSQRSFHDSRE